MAGKLVCDTIEDGSAVSASVSDFVNCVPKAWCIWNQSSGTPTIVDSYNISSLTDTAVGRVTINFTSPMSDANYLVCGAPSYPTDGSAYIRTLAVATNNKTSSALPVELGYANSGADALEDSQEAAQIIVFDG